MLDDAADVVERGVGKSAVLVAREEGFAFFLQGLVHVHAAAVVADERLRHEGCGLTVTVGDVQDGVLEDLYLVGLLDEGAGADADLALATGGNFVVVHFDLQAHLFQRKAHGRADVLKSIDRRNREVAALDARTVSRVALLVFLRGIPGALHGVDAIAGSVHVVVVSDAVEDEEFVLGTEQRVVGDARRLQIRFRALGERARIAFVALHGGGLDHIAADVDRRLFEEGIEDGGARIERENHVRLVDALPSADGRAIEHLAVAEQILVDEPRWDRHVLLFAARVREAQVRELDLFFFYQFDDISG